MFSLAQMLDSNPFSMSGRPEPSAVLGSVPLLPVQPGSILPALPWRELLQTACVEHEEKTPPALSGSNCCELQRSPGRQRESVPAVCLCVSMCGFSLAKKKPWLIWRA